MGVEVRSVRPTDTSPVEEVEGHLIIASADRPCGGQKSSYRIVYWHCKGEGIVFLLVFGQSRAGIIKSFPVLLEHSFPRALAIRSRLFWRLCFCCCCFFGLCLLAVPGCRHLQRPTQETWETEKKRGTHCSVIPLQASLPSSFQLLESSYVCLFNYI